MKRTALLIAVVLLFLVVYYRYRHPVREIEYARMTIHDVDEVHAIEMRETPSWCGAVEMKRAMMTQNSGLGYVGRDPVTGEIVSFKYGLLMESPKVTSRDQYNTPVPNGNTYGGLNWWVARDLRGTGAGSEIITMFWRDVILPDERIRWMTASSKLENDAKWKKLYDRLGFRNIGPTAFDIDGEKFEDYVIDLDAVRSARKDKM